MPKASSYKIDSNVTFNDIIFGSDGDNNLKTKNFTIESLLSLLEGGDSIKIPKKKTIILSTEDTFLNGLQSNDLTVAPNDSPVLIEFLKEEFNDNTNSTDINKFLFLFPLGAGTYSPLSSFITLEDLTLLNVTKPNLSDVESLDNSVVFDLGNLTNEDFVQIINNTTPSFDLSDSSSIYFFTFFDNGEKKLFKFIGSNGIYGLNNSSVTSDDFVEFSTQITDDDDIIVAKKVITLPQTSYSDEQSELNDVASRVNNSSSLFNVTSKEIFIVEANELQNDANENYKSLYIVTSGKGSYGSGGKTITSSDLIKIRGERIDKNLSSFNNDAGFSTSTTTVPTNISDFNNDVPYATESYVDNLVSFRGEKTSVSDVLSITSPSNGDYATVNTSEANQLWVYIGGQWVIEAAEHTVLNRNSQFSLSNLLHKKTIIFNPSSLGTYNLTLPTSVIDGIEVFVKNTSEYSLNLITSGAGGSIEGEDKILPQRSVYITKEGTTFYTQVNERKKGENVEYGLYSYEDNQSSQSLTSGTFSDLSNNGAGVNTYKDPIDGISDTYDISTDRFDFSGLSVGDIVDIGLNAEITTASAGEVFDGVLVLAVGSGNEIRRTFFSSKYFKDAGTYAISEFEEFFVSSNIIKDNPAKIEVKTSGNSSIDVKSFTIKIIKRG